MQRKLWGKAMSAFLCGALLLTGCGSTTEAVESTESQATSALPTGPEDSDVYVEAVPNLSDDFIRGMDLSTVLVEENSGVTYYNFDGEEQDVFQTFAEAGVNYVRLRVWNDPYDEEGNGYGGGNNDLATAIELGERATKYGMQVCIDFHYSDFWADWKRQNAPKAWEDMTVEEKAEALDAYTTDSLTQLLDAGVDVSMVQVGNEINYGMAGETDYDNVITLLKAGCGAVRQVSEKYGKDIKTVIHYTKINETDKIYDLVKKLDENQLDYDVLGLSYYPFWDGSFENMQTVVSTIRETYGKEVILAETSYGYTTEEGDGTSNSFLGTTDAVSGYPATVQGQTSMIRDVVNAANEAGASGVFYWEGAWLPVGDADEDNSSIWEEFGSGWASSYAGEYDPTDAGLYYGGCAWENQAFFDYDGNPLASINVWKYLKYGTTLESALDYDPSVIGVRSTEEEMVGSSNYADYENLVQNPGFEEEDTSMWIVSYVGDANPTDFFENPADAYSGDYSFHFFSDTSDMTFSIEQTFTDLEPGVYDLTAFSQGGDFTDGAEFELYAVTSAGEEVEAFQLTTYIDWKNPTISGIEVEDGNLTIGVRIKTNVNSWGTVDDFGLYKVE